MLTEKKALEICLELWEWLAETGCEYKFDWPGWKKYGNMANYCPLCEFINQQGLFDCVKCPIYWRSKPGLQNSCDVFGDSPYSKWSDARTSRTRKKYALQIVQLAKDALEKLERGGE